MPTPVAVSRWMTLCFVVLLAACGGSGGGPGAPTAPVVPPTPPAPATVLAVSVSHLALAANRPLAMPAAIPGNPRQLTVSNTGADPALALTLDSTLLPAGTTVTANTCAGTLAAGASCTITITPGTTATTLPVTLTVRGSNTNTLTTNVEVLAYGSIYQGGVVFALDDTTPSTGSVGGKVTARTEAPAGGWSPDFQVVAADSLSDGASNTAAILATYSDALVYPATAVAARACSEYSDAGYADWYLPAICEMGYDQTAAGSGCGTQAAPLMQNVQSNIVDGGLVAGAPGAFWSSTQAGGPGAVVAWSQYFQSGASNHSPLNKALSQRLLCVRALTL